MTCYNGPMASVEKVIAEALELSDDDRHRVAREMVISLDKGSGDVAEAWGTEIGSRVQDILDGKVQMLDGREVHRKIRDRLAKGR